MEKKHWISVVIGIALGIASFFLIVGKFDIIMNNDPYMVAAIAAPVLSAYLLFYGLFSPAFERLKEKENNKKYMERTMAENHWRHYKEDIEYTTLIDAAHTSAPVSSQSTTSGHSVHWGAGISTGKAATRTTYNVSEKHTYTFMVYYTNGTKKPVTVDGGTMEYTILMSKLQ